MVRYILLIIKFATMLYSVTSFTLSFASNLQFTIQNYKRLIYNVCPFADKDLLYCYLWNEESNKTYKGYQYKMIYYCLHYLSTIMRFRYFLRPNSTYFSPHSSLYIHSLPHMSFFPPHCEKRCF